ncbi:MAG: polyphosphate kinase 2 family protein [Candidatus Eremiobacteraeota bacterium]|nr:polyphosphate kinase 2 family protein [Candidatus Eremiobacteraeota bacterium]
MALLEPVKPGKKFRLADCDPGDTAHVRREEAASDFERILDSQLPELQELLYAAYCNAVLIVLQGIDTSGKDGTIKHVMSRLNPAGVRVESFKAPNPREQAHDFLWRVHRVAPARGWVGIFNRSHYEDVLVTRVEDLVPKSLWKDRYERINDFERMLVRENNTIVMKFFLYISKEEQKKRLLAREDDKSKAWKLSVTDWEAYDKYDDYIDAYQDALEKCSTDEAPWYVVPADHKWFRNLAVAQTIADTLRPYEKVWRQRLTERGERILKEIEAQKAGLKLERRRAPRALGEL